MWKECGKMLIGLSLFQFGYLGWEYFARFGGITSVKDMKKQIRQAIITGLYGTCCYAGCRMIGELVWNNCTISKIDMKIYTRTETKIYI